MKRTPLPPRRKPLARNSKPLARSPLKRQSHATSQIARSEPRKSSEPTKSRARPRPASSSRNRRSVEKSARALEHEQIREQVFARDGRRCRLRSVPGAGRCSGPISFHHRRKGGQGGGYTLENGATLCTGHNDRLEADADLALLARTMGLVLKRGDRWTEEKERFWALVDRDGPIPAYRPELGPCWLWRGTRRDALEAGDDATYGRWREHAGGPQEYVHRYALGCVEALVEGLEVDHLCRVRLCCNPRHLEQVTPAENRRRQAEARPIPSRCRKDLHDMTPENTIGPRPGRYGRECRACRTERQSAWYEREKEAANR
jgi:hypothetical protein